MVRNDLEMMEILLNDVEDQGHEREDAGENCNDIEKI